MPFDILKAAATNYGPVLHRTADGSIHLRCQHPSHRDQSRPVLALALATKWEVSVANNQPALASIYNVLVLGGAVTSSIASGQRTVSQEQTQ